MRVLLTVAILLLVTTGASAGERVFVPVAGAGQMVELDNGEALLVAPTSSAVLFVTFLPRDRKSAWVKIGVKNISESAFLISDKSVTGTTPEGILEVVSYEDRIREQKRAEMWQGIATGLAAAGNSMSATNAGYQTTYGTYSGTATAHAYGAGKSSYATAYGSGTHSQTTYNPAAAQQAQAAVNQRNQALFDRQQANTQFARQDLQDRALKANTVSPGEFVLGDVRFELPKRNKKAPVDIVLQVDVAGTAVSILLRESP